MAHESHCSGNAERGEQLVAYLYDDLDASERVRFESHLSGCRVCRDELAALGGVRRTLTRWVPADPVTTGATPLTSASPWSRLAAVPVWAQAAAAMLVVGAAAGLANIEMRYGSDGVVVRTGWSRPAAVEEASGGPAGAAPSAVSATAPWQADLEALARDLRSELGARPAAAPEAVAGDGAAAPRQVQALVQESERRQQRELALRLAEVVRDAQAQRRADLEKIQYSLGLMESNLGAMQNIGVEVMRQRQIINDLAVPVSQGR